MKTKLIGILICTLLITASSIAVADWDPEDGHKMHWPQTPDPNGWDVYCTAGLTQFPYIVLADDWECSETGWIKDIHLWGSWWGDNIGKIDHFVMGIAENIPEPPYSRPGETLIEWEIYDWVERGPYTGNQGWYWSFAPEWDPDNHHQYWQYNFFLDEEDWFWQEEGEIYWLFVSAIVQEEPTYQPLWGWKSTFEDLHFMDDAVWAEWYELYWIPLEYPSGLTMDLAFIITGGEECNPGIDVEKYVWDPDNNDWIDADTAADALDLTICTDARFKIVITNTGDCTLVDISVHDKMHDSLKYISATPNPDDYAYDPPHYYMDWFIPVLDPAEPFTIEITAHVEGPDCSTDYNYVEVKGNCDCDPTIVTDEDYAYVHAYKKSRELNTPFQWFLQQYLNMFPLFQKLLQRLELQ